MLFDVANHRFFSLRDVAGTCGGIATSFQKIDRNAEVCEDLSSMSLKSSRGFGIFFMNKIEIRVRISSCGCYRVNVLY